VKRRLRFVFVATSLLLLAVTVTLWVRSYWRVDWLNCTQPDRISGIRSDGGRIVFDVLDLSDQVPAPIGQDLCGWRRGSFAVNPREDRFTRYAARKWRFFGFAYLSQQSPHGATLAIPCWSIAPLLLIAPAIALQRAWRRRWNERHRRCPTCGYDLRATPERCPECGTALTPSPRYAGERGRTRRHLETRLNRKRARCDESNGHSTPRAPRPSPPPSAPSTGERE
jgi:hypothetical protein